MILALESSCDETAVAVFDPARGLTGEWIHSQIALHEAYGGVVPDLASREHLAHFGPLLERALGAVPAEKISRIAVTNGPGLAACLAMGLATAKSLGLAWGVPIVGVNHLRAHAFSPFIALHAGQPATFDAAFARLLPHLGLLVSGGNTALFSIDESRRIRLLASTMDDAAGEALDKGAKLLGLGYPGGPAIDRLAAQGNPAAYSFPRPLLHDGTYNFSFSGFKTAVRQAVGRNFPQGVPPEAMPDLCASAQEAIAEVLTVKTARAAAETRASSVVVAGGVSANSRLRAMMQEKIPQTGATLVLPRMSYCIDNAAMIGYVAARKLAEAGAEQFRDLKFGVSAAALRAPR